MIKKLLAFSLCIKYDTYIRIDLFRFKESFSLSVSDRFQQEKGCVAPVRQLGDCRTGEYIYGREKLYMEKMYEVLKFIEHGTRCRQSMDCVQGTILLNYLKKNPQIEKVKVLGWFRDLAVCVDQYHRSHGRQDFRYLNPCSIVISAEEKVFLLDMDAPDNADVMKHMQKRAVRSHFVKPVYEIGIGKNNEADLFAYGKTIQFILAYTDIIPSLNHREESRLFRLISRCTGESRKKYEDLSQVLKDLPAVPRCAEDVSEEKRRTGRVRKVVFSAAAVCLVICVLIAAGREKETYSYEIQENNDIERKQTYIQEAKTEIEEVDTSAVKEVTEKITAAGADLSESFERQRLLEETINAYGRLMEVEEDSERIKAAGLRKMKLEMKKGNYARALKTAEQVTEKTGVSKEVIALSAECEAAASGAEE